MCRPLGLPLVVGATTGMAISAVVAFALCRYLPWMRAPTVVVPRCTAGSPHHFVDTARQGPRWLARRMLAWLLRRHFWFELQRIAEDMAKLSRLLDETPAAGQAKTETA